MAKKKKTYRRARARRYFYKRKKGVFTSGGILKVRFVKLVRLQVLNNMQGVGTGYYWFNFNANTTIVHEDFNIWTHQLKPDSDFANLANQYTMFKPYGISITAVPSNMNVNTTNNRRDALACIACQPVRAQVNYNQRFVVLDPFASTKMYWKVGSYTQWCYSNPSAEQEQTDNINLVNLHNWGNSDVQPYELCPVWTIRICTYVKFKNKCSD